MRFKIGIIIFVVLLLLIIATYRNYGVSWDETSYRNYGLYFIQTINNFFSPKIIVDNSLRPSRLHLMGHGVVFTILECAAANFIGGCSFNNLHLVKASLQIITFIFVYLFSAKFIFKKKPWLALSSFLLLLIFPRYFGEIFDNMQDTLAVLLTTVIIYFSYLFLKEKKVRTLKFCIFLGIIFGVAVGERIILIYLPFLFMTSYLILYLSKKELINWKNYLIQISTILAAMFLVWYLTSPYLLLHPFRGIFDLIVAGSRYPWPLTVLFEGKNILATKLPYYYIYKWTLITTPPLSLLFFSIGSFFLITSFSATNFFLFFSFFLPLILILIFNPVVYDGWRHFLFLTAPFVLIASFGFYYLLSLKNKLIKSLAIILFILNIIFTGYKMINLHPYEYLYFNAFVGGLASAYGKYETDYAGRTFKEAIEWLKKNELKETNKAYNIFVCGNPDSSTYYFTPNMKQTKDLRKADYFVCYTRFGEYKLIDDKKTIFTVVREKTPLNFVKKL